MKGCDYISDYFSSVQKASLKDSTLSNIAFSCVFTKEYRKMKHYRVDEQEVYRSGEWARFCNFLLEFTWNYSINPRKSSIKLVGITTDI
jgi:hypothetical protein